MSPSRLSSMAFQSEPSPLTLLSAKILGVLGRHQGVEQGDRVERGRDLAAQAVEQPEARRHGPSRQLIAVAFKRFERGRVKEQCVGWHVLFLRWMVFSRVAPSRQTHAAAGKRAPVGRRRRCRFDPRGRVPSALGAHRSRESPRPLRRRRSRWCRCPRCP